MRGEPRKKQAVVNFTCTLETREREGEAIFHLHDEFIRFWNIGTY